MLTVQDIGNTLQRLTNLFPPDSTRKAHIDALKADSKTSLPYAHKTLLYLMEYGGGIARSEARKALENFPS